MVVSKNTSIQQVLLIQFLPKNLAVTLQNLFMSSKISQNNFPSNHEVTTTDEIQKHRYQLKSGKASNDVDRELLKKYKHLLMLQVIAIQTTYGQIWMFLPFRVILDLKLSGREQSQSRILVSIEDLALDRQCAS